MEEKPSYGGQAVIEGVMMRGQEKVAVAVRRPSQEIIVKEIPLPSWRKGPFFKLPFIRGVRALVEALFLGIKALQISAEEALEEEEEELTSWELILTMGGAFLMAILLFVVLPAFLIRLIQPYVLNHILLNFVEGFIKVILFLSYILLISRIPDMKRVFQYHGAEHKVIHAFEDGQRLSPKDAGIYSTLHPRCGTSFLLIVILLSILFFSFFGRPPFFQRIFIHLALLPFIAGSAYELIRLCGKKDPGFLIRILSAPGLLLQRLTTGQPDQKQLEVAVEALQRVLITERKEGVINLGPHGKVQNIKREGEGTGPFHEPA